ncbi:MAG: hypothetical protein IPH93_15220 [Saprospiraceae bacterium]|nr:hypothetical protein [Saprospiraceae bacterium]
MVNAYSKIDFNPDNEKDVKYLVDEIVRIGDESWITANNSPTGEAWKKCHTPIISLNLVLSSIILKGVYPDKLNKT